MRCFAYRCRSRAWAACEPCQAGNRAALSGACPVPRSSLHLYAKQRSRVLCPLFFVALQEVSRCTVPCIENGVPSALRTWLARRPSSRPCRTRFLPGASAMRICSPAPAAPARRPAPRSLPRRSTVWTLPAPTPAASVKFVRALIPVPSWTSSRWMPRQTTALTTSATCATR